MLSRDLVRVSDIVMEGQAAAADAMCQVKALRGHYGKVNAVVDTLLFYCGRVLPGSVYPFISQALDGYREHTSGAERHLAKAQADLKEAQELLSQLAEAAKSDRDVFGQVDELLAAKDEAARAEKAE